MKVSLFDFDAKRSALMACGMISALMVLILFWPVVAWVILACFGLMGAYLFYDLHIRPNRDKPKVQVLEPERPGEGR